jgi:hypothetical protein
MKAQTRHCETARSLAGLATGGVGLFLLFGRIAGAAGPVVHLVRHTADGLVLVSSVMQASSLTLHQVEADLLTLLWPLALVLLGTFLISSASAKDGTREGGAGPCVRWA